MKRSGECVACVLAIVMLGVAAFADEAGQVFDSLYGPKIKQVSATVDRADDIALAKEMLAVAKDSGSTPRLQALLCDAAGDLAGKHPDGFAVAVEAMQLLAGAQDGQREAARVKLIDLLTKQSRTGKTEERAAAGDELIDLLITMGDEKMEKKQDAEAAADYRRANTAAVQRKSEQLETIKVKTEFAAARDRAVKQIARLQEKLLADANDSATAEELVKNHVVELDTPAAALPFLNRVKNETLARMIPLAARGLEELKAEDSLELGQWYKSLGDSAITVCRRPMLARSKAYLEHFQTQHSSVEDLTGRKAQILLKQVDEALAKELPAAVTRGAAKNKRLVTNSIGMKLMLIKPGEFLIGSPDSEKDRIDNETQHRVKLTKSFYIGVHEVTQAEYEAVMGQNPSQFKGKNRPVEMVSFDDAIEFCARLSKKEKQTYRLPTEAEWEYSCRAGTTTRYSFGNDDRDLMDYAWHSENAQKADPSGTRDVGTKKPNAWGLYDMHGNVWEWVSDKYAPFTKDSVVDPVGPTSGQHLHRGGSWTDRGYCRSAMRYGQDRHAKHGTVGFRVVME